MRKLLVPAAIAVMLAASGFAFAAAMQHTTGTVKAFDAKAMTLTLDDGTTYSLSKKFKDPGIKAGEKVTVNWEQNGSKKMADEVKIMK